MRARKGERVADKPCKCGSPKVVKFSAIGKKKKRNWNQHSEGGNRTRACELHEFAHTSNQTQAFIRTWASPRAALTVTTGKRPTRRA